jgi:hypothetical protein
MPSARRCLLAATAVLALAAPTADAATRMVATVTPELPQFSPAGDISHVRVSCAAEDAKAIRTSVRCWGATGLTASSTQNLPAAAASVRGYSPWTFTLCAEARFDYGTHSGTTGVVCTSGTNGLAALTG